MTLLVPRHRRGEAARGRGARRRAPGGPGPAEGTALWAKSGDAYDFHHLVGRVALPNGSDFVLAVFTKGVKDVPGIIPRVYEKVAAHFAAAPSS